MTRWLLFRLLVLVLAGCQPRNLSPFVHEPLDSRPPALQGNQALIIVGLSTDLPGESMLNGREPFFGGWMQIDPATLERSGLESLEWRTGYGLATPRMVKGGTGYHVYVAPAGTYALGWLQRWNHFHFAMEFEKVSTLSQGGLIFARTFSPKGLAKSNVPIFTVNPGEVVYVGDLKLRWANKAVYWSSQRSDDGMAKFLSEEGITAQPVVRPMRRADGAAFTESDGMEQTDLK